MPLNAGAAGFSDAAGDVKKDLEKALQEKAEKDKEIALKQEKLTARLNEMREKYKLRQNELETVRTELAALRAERDRLKDEHKYEAGKIMEIEAAVRDFAEDVFALSEGTRTGDSLLLSDKNKKNTLIYKQTPGPEELQGSINAAFELIRDSAKISSGPGMIIDRSGLEQNARVIDIGLITRLHEHNARPGYLIAGPASSRLLMAAAPSWWVRRNLESWLAGESETVYLDVSGGAAIKSLAEKGGAWEKIKDGGFLIWPILLVGFAGFILVLERLLFWIRIRGSSDDLVNKITELLKRGDIEGATELTGQKRGGPVAAVLGAGLGKFGAPREAVESSLSEAVLRQTPILERFLPTLKVLAAVAPLLGLLGTVTGIINTFNVITAHGTGDPRLMAGGISEALITTQLGLAAAIPLMIAVALLGKKAHNLALDMEEKALALMAAMIESEECSQ